MKKVVKGKHFADMEEVKQKTVDTLKGIKIEGFKTVLRGEKKCFDRYIASNKEYFEDD